MSALVAVSYVSRFIDAGGQPWFYQQEFGAAVMQACGFGYVNPEAASQPALTAFLERKTDAIDCGSLGSLPVRPLTSMQRAFRYLMTTVAQTWALRGSVAWSALLPLYAALYGTTIVLAYAVFRQATGRLLAAFLALALATSTLHLNNLPHLRDYAKAPFVLAIVLLALRLVLKPFDARRTLLLAAAAGVVTGIGVGFRNDLLVAIPAVPGVLIFFLPGSFREQWKARLAAGAAYALAVFLAMWPMASIYQTGGGGSTPHLVLLGLTPEFSARLGVDNSRLYEVGFEYRDELALAMIDNYSDRRLGDHRFLPMYSADYDRAAERLLTEYARDFPADLVSRVYASAIRITQLPHLESTAAVVVPAFMPASWQRILQFKIDALRWVGQYWPWPLLLGIVALSVGSVRLGLFALATVAYLSGYPALQFQERHFFHLEFVAWLAFGFAATLLYRGVQALATPERRADVRRTLSSPPHRRQMAVVAAGFVALAAIVVTPLLILRQYQAERVRDLWRDVRSAQRTDLPMVSAPGTDGRAIIPTTALIDGLPKDGGVHAAYVAAEFGGGACDALRVGVTRRYRAATPGYDFTHLTTVDVPPGAAPAQLVFPAYFRNPGSTSPVDEPMAFAGLELPADQVNCLQRLSTLTLPSHPVLLDLRLPPDYERVTPFATISGVEWRQNPARVYTFPEDLSRSAVTRALAASPLAFSEQDILKVSPTFEMHGAAWNVHGAGGVGGRGPLLYLVEMKPRRFEHGSAFIAEGTIHKGGVTFGLVADDEWKVQLHVVQTGDFSVVIVPPQTRDYKVVFANNLNGMSLMNHVSVRRAGVVSLAR